VDTRKSTNLILFADQLKVLQQLLSQTKVTKPKTTIAPNLVVSLANQGTLRHSLISFKFPIDSWIIDKGASYHMTGSLELLSAYEPCSQGLTMSMADGTIAMAQGKGTAIVAGLNLKSVLYVLDLKYNLLSVSKLTKE